ncbi:hypothetical protein ACHAXM_003003 [Skeletonema potamos]
MKKCQKFASTWRSLSHTQAALLTGVNRQTMVAITFRVVILIIQVLNMRIKECGRSDECTSRYDTQLQSPIDFKFCNALSTWHWHWVIINNIIIPTKLTYFRYF